MISYGEDKGFFRFFRRFSHVHVERNDAHGTGGGRDIDSEIRGWKMVETLLRLRGWKYLDVDVHRPLLRLRQRYLLLQVSVCQIFLTTNI